MKPPVAGCCKGGVGCRKVWLGWAGEAGWLVAPVLGRVALVEPREEELREPALPLLLPPPARAQESSAAAKAKKPRAARMAMVFRVLLNQDMGCSKCGGRV
jgi:hypothetical protein